VCNPLQNSVQACNTRYAQGPSGTLLPNGDLVILVNAGFGPAGQCGGSGSSEGVFALVFPNTPGVSPRWYPIYGTNNWSVTAGCAQGVEHEIGFPTQAFFNNSWHIAYSQTFYPPSGGDNNGRTSRIETSALTLQPTSRTAVWITPDGPCAPLFSNSSSSPPCAYTGEGTLFDHFVNAVDGSVYLYHRDDLQQNCQAVGTQAAIQREKITQSGSYPYQHTGCLTFPAGGGNYVPDVTDIARGSDGKYYLLGSPGAFDGRIDEFSSTDGISFTLDGRSWTVSCATLQADPGMVETDCNIPITNCFVYDGGYVRDSTGVIVTPRIIVGQVGNTAGVDGSWHLYYWADAGAALPATFHDSGSHVAYAPSCPAPPIVVGGQPGYSGNFDGFSADRLSVSGWAWDWYQPTTPINMDIYVDSALFTTLAASNYRSDLGQPADPTHFYYGGGYHGWSWPVTSWFRDGLQHTVDVRYGGTQQSQSGGPQTYSIAAPASAVVNPTSVTGGSNAAFSIQLTQAAPSGGLAVTLSSSDTSATLPSTTQLTMPAVKVNRHRPVTVHSRRISRT
jgi:hypothetical protein